MNDLQDCIRWVQDPEVMHHVLQHTVEPEDEKKWLEQALVSDIEKTFIITVKDTGQFIGTCAIHLIATSPVLRNEPGVSIGLLIGEKSYWGKGYGAEVVKALAGYCHANLNYERVWLTVDSIHARAIRAYEKAGFRIVRELTMPERIHSNGKQYLMEMLFA